MRILPIQLSSSFISFGLFIACTVAPVPARPQSQSAPSIPSDQKHLAYEVISITPNKTGNENSAWRSAPDGIFLTNVPLNWLVRSSFGIIVDDQLSGLPAWADSDRFDIQARMDQETVAAWKSMSLQEKGQRQRILLQSLLVERCQLQFHRETKQLPVYELVIAKGGLKLKESKPNPGSRTMVGNDRFNGEAVSIDSLIFSLSGDAGRVIVDKTGLSDKKFDIDLKWTPDEKLGLPDAGPSLFAAIEEQLGLKLVSSKGPVETFVVDRLEKPTPN